MFLLLVGAVAAAPAAVLKYPRTIERRRTVAARGS
jgi:hypothetical protein